MSATPTYASTPRCGSVQLTNAIGTAATAFSNLTPPAAGTRINEIRCHSGPTTAPGGTYAVEILVNDGTNDRIVDKFALVNTADTQQAVLSYGNLILPTGYSLKAVVRTAIASGATLDLVAFGADLT